MSNKAAIITCIVGTLLAGPFGLIAALLIILVINTKKDKSDA